MSVASRTLGVAAFAAAVLAFGLVLTVRAGRASAKLGELRSEFVATVTHELKTPVAAIRALGDTMVSGRLTDPASHREYAQLVVQESKRLTRLIDNLLAYSRITDVTEAYAFEPLDLSAAIAEAVGGFRPQLDEQGFQVLVDLPPGPAVVRADRTAVHLMLDNLIDNAIRYSRDARWLGLRVRAEGDRLVVEVSDRGVGIPADEIDHVVRKFARGREARAGGSGLGLAIARRIVADHGGHLAISSRVGEGTTVSVSLARAVGR